MLIPLDYYRILGLPIQATADQLKQAHRDRYVQLPRREYSERAIAARKQLLDEAYGILSDPESRGSYDATFLAKTLEFVQDSTRPSDELQFSLTTDPWVLDLPERPTPSIEISNEQFPGALLILQELGEYELVLNLARPYLTKDNLSIQEGEFGDPQFTLPDIVLSVALAYLELGREQWQQGQHENAAKSLESGQDILLRENLFVNLRGEMQADLYKLRPYRVMELLALPLEKRAEREQGLQILRDMLQERGGIDGNGDDRSGLSIEDFLRFVQQLRRHLTTSEQQNLFEAEARRPSAVATYLAVYALIAQGFAQRQPALILRGKLLLMQLGRRQDVHLEKALCSLLLGQTDEASQAVELSQEQEPIAFIRENSQDSPDLLPGLCLYAGHWLQEEVFPHFRDLVDTKASLKEYFADRGVQSYLEALPAEAKGNNEWVVVPPHEGVSTRLQVSGGESLDLMSPLAGKTETNAMLTPTLGVSALRESSSLRPLSERRSSRVPSARVPVTSASHGGSSVSEESRRFSSRERRRVHHSSVKEPEGEGTAPSHEGSSHTRHRAKQTTSQLLSLPITRLLLLGAGFFLALSVLWLILSWFVSVLGSFSGPQLKGEQPLIALDKPPVEMPKPKPPEPAQDKGPLTEELGAKVIEQWLTAKRAALGQERTTDQLKAILVDPALSQWIQRAETQKRNNTYQRYEHNVKVNSVKMTDNNPNEAQVDVEVREKAELMEKGDQVGSTRDDTLRIRYDLVRKDGKWYIRDWSVLR